MKVANTVVLATVLFLALAGCSHGQAVISVNLSEMNYPASTRATGFLFGLQENSPCDDLIVPLNPLVYRFNQNPGYDVVKRLPGLNTKLPHPIRPISVVSDWYYPPWSESKPKPGTNGNWTYWETKVAELVEHNLALGFRDGKMAYDVWNEPDYTMFWDGTEEEALEVWYRGAQLIRAKNSGAILVGPSIAFFNVERLARFLDYILSRDRSLIPQILAWHEVDTPPSSWEEHVRQVRALLARYGDIGVKEVHIHEYGNLQGLNIPARALHAMAAIDRSQVDAALRSIFWPTGGNCDTMGGLLSADLRPTAIWHCYAEYAKMAKPDAKMYRIHASNESLEGLFAIEADGSMRGMIGALNENGQPVQVQLKITGRNSVLPEKISATLMELPNGTTFTRDAYETAPLVDPHKRAIDDKDVQIKSDQVLVNMSVPANGVVSLEIRPR